MRCKIFILYLNTYIQTCKITNTKLTLSVCLSVYYSFRAIPMFYDFNVFHGGTISWRYSSGRMKATFYRDYRRTQVKASIVLANNITSQNCKFVATFQVPH